MTAAEIIGEIRRLPDAEQDVVVQFTETLKSGRVLSGRELGGLAEQLLATQDSREQQSLRAALERGFYGSASGA